MSDLSKALKNKGSILVFMLVIILLLSVFAQRLMKKSVEELKKAPFSRGGEWQASLEASSALEAAHAALFAKHSFGLDYLNLNGFPGGGLQSWLAKHGVKANAEKYRWNIQARNNTGEDGKLPFDKMNEKQWIQVFGWLHSLANNDPLFDDDDGQPYYDAMKDWQDKDDEDEEEGAEDDYYEKFGYFCKDEKILDFADFKRIKGFFYDSDLVQSSGLFYDLNGTETNQFKKFKNIVSFFNPDQANWHAFSPDLKDFLASDDDRLREDLDEYTKLSWRLSILPGINEQRDGFSSLLTGAPDRVAEFHRLSISAGLGASGQYKISALLQKDSQKAKKLPKPSNKKNRNQLGGELLPRSKENEKLGYWRFIKLDCKENL